MGNEKANVKKSFRLDSRKFLIILGIITGAGILLRLIVSAQLTAMPSVANPSSVTDMATYQKTAQGILNGRWPDFFYYQPFYYAVFLPIIYKVFGTGPWGVIFIQTLLAGATVWLTGLSCAKLFGRTAGIIAALLLALSRTHIFYTPYLLIAVLQSFWIVLLLYIAIRFRETRGKKALRNWILLSVFAALGTLTRGNILLLTPIFLLLLIEKERKSIPKIAVYTGLFVVLFYLPQLPFAIKNYTHFGRWTGPSSAQDAVLALSNTPEATPGALVIPYPDAYSAWMKKASNDNPNRRSVIMQMLDWFKEEPLALPELKFRALLLFWDHDEIWNNIAMQNEGKASSVLRKSPFLIHFGAISMFGLAGIVLLLLKNPLRHRKRFFLALLAVFYCLATVLFYILTRFRLPMYPFLAVLSGYFLSAVISAVTGFLHKKRFPDFKKQTIYLVGAATIAAFFTFAAFDRYRDNLEAPLIRIARPDGTRLAIDGKMKIYDHGQNLYGGWVPEELPPKEISYNKTFVLPNGYSQLSGNFLRIAMLSAKGGNVAVKVVCKHFDKPVVQHETVKPSAGIITWVDVPLPDFSVNKRDVTFNVAFRAKTPGIAIIFDYQRDYGRTDLQVGETQLPVEAVIEFRTDEIQHAILPGS